MYDTCLHDNVWKKESKSVQTGANGHVYVDGVYASNLFILPLSRKRSAEITVWKDTVLSAEGERDSGTMECHHYSCQEHFSHAPRSQDFPQQPRIALLSSPNSHSHTHKLSKHKAGFCSTQTSNESCVQDTHLTKNLLGSQMTKIHLHVAPNMCLWNTKEDILKDVPVYFVFPMKVNGVQTLLKRSYYALLQSHDFVLGVC